MKNTGINGNFPGCWNGFANEKLVRFAPPSIIIPINIPTAEIIRNAPNIGYTLPMIASIGNNVATR
ncbi:hypothetical protein SDC9_207579 [bioreactor metagenome]|uniref:Uncharacterized protein n=1 Tax=bioreactor metagenome TaxID=1076179 RepID=A0A645J8Z4_9ZZZZ